MVCVDDDDDDDGRGDMGACGASAFEWLEVPGAGHFWGESGVVGELVGGLEEGICGGVSPYTLD